MQLKLIECPRDAMQGLHDFIPTETKISYINALLRVGFDTIDFGSFVSPKAIPQLKDTVEVLANLDLSASKTRLLAIVANLRGAREACLHPEIKYLGFPFSVSPTFLNLNIRSNSQQALQTIEIIQNLCVKSNQELVVYLSMAFGNPYGDDSSISSLIHAVEKLKTIGIKIISFADTVGVGEPETIEAVFKNLLPAFPDIEFGMHLHTTSDSYYKKIDAAYRNGCRRFDSVILGLGGCPMSARDLVGNLDTESLVGYFTSKGIEIPLNKDLYQEALMKARRIFPIVL